MQLKEIVILILFVAAIIFCLVKAVLAAMRNPYKRDPNNPYSYICKLCGQYFITKGELGTSFYDEIVPGGKIINIKCRCMKPYLKEDYYKKLLAEASAHEENTKSG